MKPLAIPALALALALAVALGPIAARAQESSPAARAALAHQLYDAALAGVASGTTQPSEVYDWSVRWMRADLEGHVAGAAQAHYDRMTALLARVHAQLATGTLAASAETACLYYQAEARAWLAHPPTVP